MSSIDNRMYTRLTLTAACTLSGFRRRSLAAVTKDVSRGGMLIEIQGNQEGILPMVGQKVVVDLDLPKNPVFGMRQLHCRGVVVRTCNSRGAAPRIAVQFSTLQFRRKKFDANPAKCISGASVC